MKISGVGTIHVPVSRRTFLATALTGAVASSLFPTALFAENERISFDNYRIVPIGRNQKPLIFFWLIQKEILMVGYKKMKGCS